MEKFPIKDWLRSVPATELFDFMAAKLVSLAERLGKRYFSTKFHTDVYSSLRETNMFLVHTECNCGSQKLKGHPCLALSTKMLPIF